MPDDKVKAAEAEEVVFPNPHLDSTSSGISFTIYSGIPTGEPPSGGGEAIGLGGGGYVAPDPGTQITFPAKAGPRKTPPPTVFMAICTHSIEPEDRVSMRTATGPAVCSPAAKRPSTLRAGTSTPWTVSRRSPAPWE